MDIIDVFAIILTILSIILAFFSIYLARKSIHLAHQSADQIDNTGKLIGSISELVNSSQDLGVTMVYEDRNAAMEKWSNLINNEKTEVRIFGTSLRGLMGNWKRKKQALRDNPGKFKFLLVHPDYVHEIERVEGRPRGHIFPDIVLTLNDLVKKYKVPNENIKLYNGYARNFTIITSTKLLINPTIYDTDSFRFFCIECECRHEDDVYHQYKEHHFDNAWNSEHAINLDLNDLEEWNALIKEGYCSTKKMEISYASKSTKKSTKKRP